MADKMMSELTFFQDSLTGKKYKPNLNFEFTVAVPTCEQAEYALLIEHDGLRNDANTKAMLRLANEGKAPYCISIGIKPGNLLMPDGTQRGMRMNSYDLFDKEYGDFIVYELIPYVLEKYSFKISDSPDMHIVSGGSSGGISAFCIAWFHPDYFRKVYMSSPSFLGMGRGNEIPYLIRKYETKPLRIYEEYSENEPNDYFGASFPIDLEALRALSFANYDFAYKYFAGEGHCSRYNDEDEAYIRMEWLCRERAHHGNSPRVDQVIPPFSKWEVCSGMPKNESRMDVKNAPYSVAVRSNDEMAVYVASANEDIVYMHPSGDLFNVGERILHASLHTIPRFDPKGAIDMAVDKADRLYVLTSIGIQCVRSFGLIDVILDLPDGAKPLEIAVTDALYVKTELGAYRRALCEICTAEHTDKRRFTSYYD